MFFAMIEVFKGAGILIYPLGICSAGAVFIICERAYALRKAAVMPEDLVDAVVAGKPLVGGRHTVLARIVEFAEQHKNDAGAVKAFARLEINRMERGVPYLDVIYAAAPLIGLAAITLLPLAGLAMLIKMGFQALPKRARDVALFFAAPFIGLAYLAAFPLIGVGALAYAGVQAARGK